MPSANLVSTEKVSARYVEDAHTEHPFIWTVNVNIYNKQTNRARSGLRVPRVEMFDMIFMIMATQINSIRDIAFSKFI